MDEQADGNRRVSQSWFASMVFAIGFWVVLIAIGFILFGPKIVTTPKGLLLTLNSFVAMLGVQTLSYFIAILANSDGLINFLSALISLLLAFFSGIFTPRELVDVSMQKVAMIATPIWNMMNVEKILDLNQWDWTGLQPIVQTFGIELGITLAYFALAYMVQRHRLKNALYLS